MIVQDNFANFQLIKEKGDNNRTIDAVFAGTSTKPGWCGFVKEIFFDQ